MKQAQRVRPVLVFLLLPLLFAGCSVQGIQVPVLRPAPVDFSPYRSVGVDKFEGPGAGPVAEELALAMRQAENPVSGKKGFEVMDHSEVDRLLDRMRGTRGDLDPHSLATLERWRSVDVIVKGRVEEHGVEDQVVVEPWVDPLGVRHRTFTRVCRAQVTVALEVLDGSDQVIDRVTLHGQAGAKSQSRRGDPAPIDHEALLAQAREEIAGDYLRRILPRQEWVTVRLYKEGDLPELEIGNGMAKSGDWDAALRSYGSALEQATGALEEHRFKALYNLGVAQQYTNRFADARESLRQAYSLGQERMILDEIQNLTQREREYELLMSQGAGANAADPVQPAHPAR